MNRVFHYMLVILILSLGAMAQNPENSIVLTISHSKKVINKTIKRYDRVIKKDKLLSSVQKKENFYTKTSKADNAYIVKVGPVKDNDTLILVYLRLRNHFPQAFILEKEVDAEAKEVKKEKVKPKKEKTVSPKIKYVEKEVYIEKEDPTLWTALFGLGIIGILSLFLSSDQIKNIKIRHTKMQEKQKETERKQNVILAKMGEKIQNAVIENLKSESKIPETFSAHRVLNENMKKYDDDLLNTTYEMIDFLKIKSGNIEIHQEPFQLSTLLHKLTNAVSELLKNNNNTFYYDVKTDVARYLVGDSLRIFQVLHNVLSNSLEEDGIQNSKVVLSIEIVQNELLIFKIINENQYLDKEKIASLFTPSSWEELQQTHKEVSFFVTNELVSQMDGEFLIESDQKNGTVYALTLPYIKDEESRSNKEPLKKILFNKKVLILDDDTLNMETLKYILDSFNIEIERQLTSYFKQHKPKDPHWDIVILNAKDITPLHLEFFNEMRKEKGLKVILMHELFESEDLVDIALQITDAEIYSPIIPGDVEEVLYQLYMAPKEVISADEAQTAAIPYQHSVKTIKITESPEVSRERFRKFSGKDILIAEDNFVNQKVMSSILSASDIRVHKAENGRQALELLEKYPQIDLILMDMSMPVMDGFAATRRIKEDSKLKDIPIIAVTGLGFNHEIERMGQVGVDACITKPFKIGQLYTAMDRYLVQEEEAPIRQELQPSIYLPDKEVLNVKQGIINAHNEIFYREILGEVKELLEKSNEHFITMVSARKLQELQVFCRDTLSLVETVGATRLVKIFKEILVFLSNTQDVSLDAYVPMYRKEWAKLKKEMELYLKS